MLFRKLLLALSLLGSAMMCGSAQAAFVDWKGGLIIEDAQNCPGQFAIGPDRALRARIRPAGLGDNGTDEKLSMFNAYWAFYLTKVGGNFTVKAWDRVNGISIAGGAPKYVASIYVTRQDPPVVDETTPAISMDGIIRRFTGFDGQENCTVRFRAEFFRP